MASFCNSQSQKEEGSTGPIFCAKNCGFFGCSETMNLCSVCYKDFMKQQDNAKAEGDSTATSMQLFTGNQSETSRDTATVGGEGEEKKSNADLKPNRCTSCKKRVGLTGFHCRCGEVFCGLHRYAEEHNCPYDYRKAAQQAIAQNNPLIKPEKFQKF